MRRNRKDIEMNVPKISVIIPVYNGKKYLDVCVQSLQKQSLKDIEMIFVDDGSTDCTLCKLKQYSDSNIVVLTQKNAGAGSARNNGIIHASGEYVAFLDVDDCYASDDTLALLYNKANINHADICGGSFDCGEKPFPVHDKRVFQNEGFIDFADYQFDYGFQRFIYKRELLLNHKIRFPGYRVYEDPVFFLKAMVCAGRFYAIPQGVYTYSGSHQGDLNVNKTIDYLKGLKDNLSLSSQYRYGKLHLALYERLKSTASYSAECNLDTDDIRLFEALIAANCAVDVELLQKEGLDISEKCLIPALCTVWKASGNYFRLKKKFQWLQGVKNIIRNLH